MFLNPNQILEQLNLKENITAADFGCGSGGWTIPLAKFLERGKVYALDILPEPLAVLKNKISLEGLTNVKVKQSDLEKEKGSGLPNNHFDLVLIPNILFQSKNKKAIIVEAKRIVKQIGQIVIIDWKKESPFGPNKKNIALVAEIKKIAKTIGLKEKQTLNAGDYHYCLVFGK